MRTHCGSCEGGICTTSDVHVTFCEPPREAWRRCWRWPLVRGCDESETTPERECCAVCLYCYAGLPPAAPSMGADVGMCGCPDKQAKGACQQLLRRFLGPCQLCCSRSFASLPGTKCMHSTSKCMDHPHQTMLCPSCALHQLMRALIDAKKKVISIN